MPTGCGHCGFKGPLEHKGNVTAETGTEHVKGYGDVDWTVYWVLDRCPACEEPNLGRMLWADEFSDPTDEPTRIYPISRDNTSLPENVRQKYDQALKVMRVDPGFYAVGIRRMLESVCNDKGAPKGDLFDRLKALVARGDLPGTLGAQAQELRNLGNLGAHDKDIDVAEADVPVIRDFAEAILEYLYRAPDQLTALQGALDERKAARKKAREQPAAS